MRLLMTFLSLGSLVFGHFQLNYPIVRGYDEDTLGTFPCGGQNTVSSNRTSWPLAGGPIQLNMEHQLTNIQVLLALGNDPGSNFDFVLDQTFTIQGIGKFCLSKVTLPSSLNITDGMNGTIQVVSNNEDGGGLYNCADVTFNSGSVSGEECTNGTGIAAVAYSNPSANANTTTTSSSQGSSISSTPGKNGAAHAGVSVWTLMLGGVFAISVTF